VVTENKTETETETDLGLQKLELGNNSTDDDDVWASATASPTAGFPETSNTGDGNSITSFADRNFPDTGVVGSNNIVESPVTSFAQDIDILTSFAVLQKSPNITGSTGVTGNTKWAAGESPLTSSDNDWNPVTSDWSTVNSPLNGDCQVVQLTGSSYPETGSSVTKLIVASADGDEPMILHRIQIPTVGEVLAEVGVAEPSSVRSAGSSETTTDYSVAALNDSMLDVIRSRDAVDSDGEDGHQIGGAGFSTNDQDVLLERDDIAATTDHRCKNVFTLFILVTFLRF